MLSGLKGKLSIIASASAKGQTVAAEQNAVNAENATGSAETSTNDCLVISARAPLPESALRVTEESLRRMDIAAPGWDIRDAVFIDTETTGLSGGAGTLAFLTGVGYVEGGELVVEQLFMRGYAEEPYMLERLAKRLETARFVVSYNGRTFDWPLLESRFAMQRMRDRWRDIPQIDLLHPARRVWKLRLNKCTLSNLEAEVLGVTRESDIPGAEVPQRYFEYLKTHVFEQVQEIIDHNRQDIITLTLLLGRLAQMHDAPAEQLDMLDVYSLGRAMQRVGDTSAAEECFRTAANSSAGARARVSLSMLYKKQRAMEQAMWEWRELDARGQAGNLPLIEQAKVYEHRLRDYEQALDLVERAQARARALGDAEELSELTHRQSRLKRKLETHNGQALKSAGRNNKQSE